MADNTQILEQFKELGEALAECGKHIAQQLGPALRDFEQVAKVVYEAFWQAYREAGAPYGETDEGLLRWVKEVGEVRRLHMEADRILMHHKMLTDFRQKFKAKND